MVLQYGNGKRETTSVIIDMYIDVLLKVVDCFINIFFPANDSSPYLPSTPGGQPSMTPNTTFLPGVPGCKPMTRRIFFT